MACRGLHGVEGDLEHEPRLHRPHRTEAFRGMAADEAVEAQQFLVGEAEVRLADRHEFVRPVRAAPQAEGVVGIVRRALAGAALGIHEHAVEGERIALPLVPMPSGAAGDIGARFAFQHQAFKLPGASPRPQRVELVEALEVDYLAQVAARRPGDSRPGSDRAKSTDGAPWEQKCLVTCWFQSPYQQPVTIKRRILLLPGEWLWSND